MSHLSPSKQGQYRRLSFKCGQYLSNVCRANGHKYNRRNAQRSTRWLNLYIRADKKRIALL